MYIRAIAPAYGIPVILHTDHCAKKLLPWLDGLLDADEKYFKEHGEPLFSSHMIDLSEEEVDYNIETTAKYLKRAAPMKQWLEMVWLLDYLRSLWKLTHFPGNRYHWW
jgi:fructose-bisphosphate aldolase class II